MLLKKVKYLGLEALFLKIVVWIYDAPMRIILLVLIIFFKFSLCWTFKVIVSTLKWVIVEHDEELRGFGMHCFNNNCF